MKKYTIALALCIACMFAMPLAAQEEQEPQNVRISEEKKSEFYYVTVPVEKVYPYRAGYVVMYRKTSSQLARVYLPVEWFTEPAGKGDLIKLGPGKTWPYLTVYYKNGEFSHIRLFVRREMGHETWGNIPMGTNLDEHFANVEDIRLF